MLDQPVEVQTGGRQTADDQVRPVLDPLQLPFDRSRQVREMTSGYRITGEIGGKKVPMTYTAVRSGGVSMLDPKQAAIPEAVVRAQLDRL
ncbi:hypothetical protein [Streptomyces chromofuscus]|uniref:Uncharacterized protein n=1 Tax=Streptomyces chromofuscus TaxID=42881 RepID=A0A7M2T3H7_STRCW|nr:hypothetical protein [Streptomyces chromofuscus]QOV43132.1 hypothetical protein IPT68_25680 [Streptomyces chromofuscus]